MLIDALATIFLIYFLFVQSVFGANHSFFLEKAGEKTKGGSESTLASVSSWIADPHVCGAQALALCPCIAPLCGFAISSSHHSCNGGDQNSALEVQILPKIEQAQCDPMWTVWSSLDLCLGRKLPASAEDSQPEPWCRLLELHTLGGGYTLAQSGLGHRQMAVAVPPFCLKVQYSPWQVQEEETQEAQEAARSTRASSSPFAGFSMEWQSWRQELFCDIGGCCIRQQERKQVGTEAQASPLCVEKARGQSDTGAPANCSGVYAGPIAGCDQAVALSSQQTGAGQKSLAEAESLQTKSSSCLEELHCRQRHKVADLLRTIRQAGHRALQAAYRGAEHCQIGRGRLGVLQEGSQGGQGCRRDFGHRHGRDLRGRKCRPAGRERCHAQGGFERYAQKPRGPEVPCGGTYRGLQQETQTERSTCSSRIWRWQCLIALSSCWPTFWQGRAIDQREIDLRPQVSLDSECLSLKWTHSVVKRRGFTSEWKAQIVAMDLAYDMGFNDRGHSVPAPSCKELSSGRASSAFCTRFNDDVTLFIGPDDEILMHQFSVPHHRLSECCRTPWKVHQVSSQFPLGEPLSEVAVLISRSCGPRRHSSTTMSADQRVENEVLPNRDTPQYPLRTGQSVVNEDWWQELVRLYDRHGCTEFLEEGPIIYVNTWYLHGVHLRRNDQARPVRLDCEWQMWPELLREAWRDRIDHDAPLEIGLVVPSPPASVFQGHVAHLILQQAMLDEPTGIVSGIFRSSRRDVIAQSAQVLPVVLLSDDMIAAVPAQLQCLNRECHIFAGGTPLLHEHPRRATPFSSVVVEVFPVPEDEEDFASFMAAGSTSRSRPTQGSLAALPHVARQEEAQHEDLESESSSEESEDLIWRYSKIFSVHQPPVEAPLHQTHERLKHMQVARAVGFRRNELLAVYDIPTPPQDLRQAQQAGVLARHADDLPEGSHHCFVLVDTEFHPIDPNEDFVRVRSPIYMPQFVTRGMLLRAMDVARYCDYVHDRCMVWHNDELFPPLPRYHLRLRHGDYLKIVLPPPNHDNARVPTRCVARLLQLDFDPEDIEPFYLVTDQVDEDLDPMPTPYTIAEANSSDVGSDQGIPEDAYEIEAEDDASLVQTSTYACPKSCHDQSDPRDIYREVCAGIETANAGLDSYLWTYRHLSRAFSLFGNNMHGLVLLAWSTLLMFWFGSTTISTTSFVLNPEPCVCMMTQWNGGS